MSKNPSGTDGNKPSITPDVDVESVDRDVDAIKEAMGIEDRYPGQARMWLVYGVVIGVAAIGTNVAFGLGAPEPTYFGLWSLMTVSIFGAQYFLVSGASESAPPRINWRYLFGSLAIGYLALFNSVGDLVASNTEGALRGIHFFSHLIVFLGLTLLITGVALGAERIRMRDRIPFYVGGMWVLVFAAFLPYIPGLRLWGLSVFGALFVTHSIGAYVLTHNSVGRYIPTG
jgi:hypothetical protein